MFKNSETDDLKIQIGSRKELLTYKQCNIMSKIILIGGGGHCKSVIDIIEQDNKFKIAGIIDKNLIVQKFWDIQLLVLTLISKG